MNLAPKTYGYYVHSQRKQLRKYLETIALKLDLDPLLPDSWYSIGTQLQQNKVNKLTDGFILIEHKFMKSLVLHYFGGSIIMALKYLFPDIDVDDSKFLGFPYILLLYVSSNI